MRAFGTSGWIEVIRRGYDLWLAVGTQSAEQNLAGHLQQRRHRYPEMAGIIAGDMPFELY